MRERMTHKWSIRAYRDGDEEGIYQLWRVVYPAYRTDWESWKRRWHWLYKENPAGNGLIWLAEANGQIVAQHALIPVKYKVSDQIVLGSWGVDAMTHPDYRRLGLFETINKELSADAKRVGIKLACGAPNIFSHTGLVRKSGWTDVAQMITRIKPVNWKNAARLKIHNQFISDIVSLGAKVIYNAMFFTRREPTATNRFTVTRVDSFDQRFDRLWSRFYGKYKILAVHNKEYLNWRYRPPDENYEIFIAEDDSEVLGYLVSSNKVVKNANTSLILTLIGESEEIMHHLVSQAIKASRQAGVDYVAYSFIAGREYHDVLRKCGFIWPFVTERKFCVHSNDTQIKQTLLLNPMNWLVQGGDTGDAIIL
jgi:hypothetical protein